MKKIMVTLALLSCFSVQAQWGQQTSPANGILHDVFFTDSLTGYIGAQTYILKTTNGGNPWAVLDFIGPDSTRMDYSFYFGLHFFSNSTGVAVGHSLLDNGTIIIRTADGGTNWTVTHLGTGNGVILHGTTFTGNNDGYAVGTNGLILHTTDGGNSWFPQVSGTTEDLFAVFFTGSSTGYAVGNQVILKTTNGGSTWVPQISPYYLSGVWFTSPATGFASAAANGIILKTTDAGATWTPISTYATGGFQDICFTNSQTGYVCGEGVVFKTSDGGVLWEQQPLTPGTTYLRAIDFPTFHTGYTIGNTGNAVIEKTTNAGGPVTPVSAFNAPAVACADSLVTFTSNGPTGYQYQWLDNGIPFGNTHSVSQTFTASTTHTITLIVTNNSLSDTSQRIVTVSASLAINLSTTLFSDSICAGNTVTIQVLNSEGGVVYRLYNGLIPVGSPQNGTGGSLSFTSGPLPVTDTLNLRAFLTNACGDTNTVTDYHIIQVFSMPNTALTVTATDTGLCYGDSTLIRVDNSEPGFIYRLRIGTTTVGIPQAGNGGTLFFPTGVLTTSQVFNIYATGITGCASVLGQQPAVTVQQAIVSFQPAAFYVIAGDSVSFTNTSNTTTYSWNFGNGASPATSNLGNPGGVIFSIADTNFVTLTGQTSFGCADTAVVPVYVVQQAPGLPVNAVYCDSIIIAADDYWDHLTNVYVDLRGNKYVTNTYINFNYWWRPVDMFLKKYDPQGNLLWTQSHITNSPFDNGVTPAAITVDHEGNVYLGGTCGTNNLQFGSVSTGPLQNEDVANAFLVKFDSLGNAQWIMYSDYSSTAKFCGVTDIEVDMDGNVYASVVRTAPFVTFHFPGGGTIQTQNPWDIYVFKMRPDGSLIRHFTGGRPFGPLTSQYGPVYTGAFCVDESVYDVTKSYSQAPQLHLLDCGNVLLTGSAFNTTNYSDAYTFGQDTLHCTEQNRFCYSALLDTLNGWQGAFPVYAVTQINTPRSIHHAVKDDTGNMYMIGEATTAAPAGDSLLIGNTVIPFRENISFLIKYDLTGNILWYSYSFNSRFMDVASDADGGVIVTGEFKAICDISTPQGLLGIKGAGMVPPNFQYYDFMVLKYSPAGTLVWTGTRISPENEKAYSTDVTTCGEIYFAMKHQDPFLPAENIRLVHLSPQGSCNTGNLLAGFTSTTSGPVANFTCTTPNATSWLWDFGDGNTSTQASPIHTYTVSGTYQVSLVVSDGTCSDQVCYPVSVFTILAVFTASDSSVCTGDTVYFTNQSLLASTYQWFVNGIPFDTAASTSYVFITAGTYTVSLIASGNGSDTAVLAVVVNSLPLISFAMPDTICLSDAPLVLAASPSGGSFSGTGIQGNVFSPAIALTGTHLINYSYSDPNGCTGIATIPVVVDGCVSVYEYQSAIPFQVYPNPVHAGSGSGEAGLFFPGAASRSIALRDAFGKTVAFWTSTGDQFRVNLGGFAPGVYSITVFSETNSDSCRLLILR